MNILLWPHLDTRKLLPYPEKKKETTLYTEFKMKK